MIYQRYARHIALSEVGVKGQEKLAAAKVLVVGAGGLGCSALQYLVSAGVGTVGIIDFDTVSLSNLQRQILYTEDDIGKNKALTAKERLHALNNSITIIAQPVSLGLDNCLEILSEYDIVVDGTDNFTTRYLISDACSKLKKPMVYASLYKFEGQVSVFNYKDGPSYRCLFPEPPMSGEVPNCSEIGILGVLPGQIGVLQATEVLKIILEIGDVLSGHLLYVNVLTNESRTLHISRNDEVIQYVRSKGLELVDIQDCDLYHTVSLSEIQPFQQVCWIDIREEDEGPQVELPNLQRIPFSAILSKNNLGLHKIHSIQEMYKKIIFCKSGGRAKKVVKLLNTTQITNCFALKEGADALLTWIKENHEE
ncbi:MAG: ThiF family adenylyltransferase [Bacteroidia bacterium]|nr:ThiF family adenylyltransferase [Bacteroidia bacterium]MBT8309061.1 ThiF family adenylyltransferase [Bacteroidia bacterium]NND11967.1 dinucleotide-utilizing protein [Flavobacteriaceae bacterium]NNK26967.1 dinucleotide-utilizing protein [Flavobacteriaceae bacterium]NNL61062.1 dinucleotide-utilizing protein [Flavobacteriaceae bacterium]